MPASSTAVAVGVTIGLVVLLLGGVALAIFLRRRWRNSAQNISQTSHRETVIDANHLAFKVTPFSTRDDTPRFLHRPGQAMRVARRRSDGGWAFSDPLVLTPPSAYFTGTDSRASCSSYGTEFSVNVKKEKKVPGELTTRGFVEVDGNGLAPPAYSPKRRDSTDSV